MKRFTAVLVFYLAEIKCFCFCLLQLRRQLNTLFDDTRFELVIKLLT